MTDYPTDTDMELLCGIAATVYQATETGQSQYGEPHSHLPTAHDLASHFGMKLDKFKKKLKMLKQYNVIHPVSASPKRYRFDVYQLRQQSSNNPIIEQLTDPDSPFYIV